MTASKSILCALVIVASTSVESSAAVYNLRADTTLVTLPDGTQVTMWGYGLVGSPAVSVPGPVLEVPPALAVPPALPLEPPDVLGEPPPEPTEPAEPTPTLSGSSSSTTHDMAQKARISAEPSRKMVDATSAVCVICGSISSFRPR